MKLHIGIAGPISTDNIAPYLESGVTSSLPIGYRGAPLLGTLIGELLSRGHQVSAYTTSSDLSTNLLQPVVAEGERFKIYYCPQRKHSIRMNGFHFGRIVDFFGLERRYLMQAIRMDNPDVIHAHWAYEFALATIASGKPHVVTCHDAPLEILKYMPNLYRLGRYFMALKAMKAAGKLTTVSPYMQHKLSKLAGGDIEVVPNLLPPQVNGFLFDRSRQLTVNNPIIAMITNGWDKHKNIAAGLIGFAKLRAKGIDARLRLYGIGYGKGESVEIWAVQQGLAEGVEFIGNTPYEILMQELIKADMFLHPSLEESFGMVVAEAMALGLPVVGGKRSGAVPWIVGKGGVLVDVTNPTEIADGLLHVLSCQEEWQKLRYLAHNASISRFSAVSVANAYERIYMQQLGRY